MKVRIKYSKTGPVKFISHLDVMRYFQKAIRRAELDIKYSTGMSPHQIISFAAPMPLMMESVGEYCDAEFESVTTSDDIIERFNNVGSPFIKMIDIVELPDDAINSMAAVTASDYLVTLTDKGIAFYKDYFQLDDSEIQEKVSQAIEDLKGEDSINVLKKTKKSEVVTDIKPLIYDLNFRNNGIYMLLATGSHENIKPENVLTALCDKFGTEYDKFMYNVLRLETYFGDKKTGFKPLSEAGNRF